MSPRKKKSAQPDQSPAKRAGPENQASNENTAAAHEQAEEDIQQDPDFNSHSPNDDLDEGESARLGEEKTDLI